jgi:hypothetical protein
VAVDSDTYIEPLSRDLMLPMLRRGSLWHNHYLIPLDRLIRREHIQWRWGHETNNPLLNGLWWYPQEGPLGLLRPVPWPKDGVDAR